MVIFPNKGKCITSEIIKFFDWHLIKVAAACFQTFESLQTFLLWSNIPIGLLESSSTPSYLA